jgi:hypothetical protein
VIVEFVGNAAGGADVRIITLWGHPRGAWRVEHSSHFPLPPEDYRRLAAAVDAAIENRVLPPPEREGREQRIVCMDGPGYLTERVTGGAVWSYTGFCPPNQDDPHPNEVIATVIRSMLCRRHDPGVRRGYWLGRRCYRPPFTMRSG